MAKIEQSRQHELDEEIQKPSDTSAPGGEDYPKQESDSDTFLICFGPDDREDPKNWSKGRKRGMTLAMSATGFNRIMISTMMAPAITTIAKDLRMTTTESTMALSVYVLASAFGPLVIGPLSEMYGRKRIVHITNIWFLVWNLICGFANSKGLLLASRLFAGFGASAVYSVAYCVLVHIYLSPFLVPPLVRSWVGLLSTIRIGDGSFGPRRFFRGSRRYARFRSLMRPTRRYFCVDEQFNSDNKPVIHATIPKTRPTNPAAHPSRNYTTASLIQAILGGIGYGLLYFALSSFSNLFVSAYNQSISISGLHYIALCAGELVGSQICGPLMDYVYAAIKARARELSPELRIPLLLPTLVFTPIRLFLYGWSAEYHLTWVLVDIGTLLFALGMQVFDITLRAYVMDAYPDHVSSASAAAQLFRSLSAFAFPLFSDHMYKVLGYGWGNSLLAFMYFGVALPSTCILWRYGARLREKNTASY
ncbi:hypothetical protein HYALB_00005376 [Hymenoscyphus albidus]|uniref:Major facilitator superfamily (MFS) profile domain-containing protein n=1 Tax=Hymenoscyphus albidus TaxID=595503 RepID=A0A9N9LHD1_9HELO|nr:hypothetical protein HYALB_00005376 [Hymenoscyphus albidus]